MQVKIQLMHKINKFIWRFLLCIKFKKRKIIEEWIGMDIDVAPSQRTSESRNIYWFQIQNDNFSALALFQVYTYTHLFHPRFKCGMIVPQKKMQPGKFSNFTLAFTLALISIILFILMTTLISSCWAVIYKPASHCNTQRKCLGCPQNTLLFSYSFD